MSAPSNPYAALSHKINEVVSSQKLKFTQVETLDALLDALLVLETSVGQAITRELGRYNVDKAINAQADRSSPLIQLSRALFQAYYLVSLNRSVMAEVVGSLGAVAKQIGSTTNKHAKPQEITDKNDAECQGKQIEFADSVGRVVLVCLAASGRTKAGSNLVRALVKSQATITVQPIYKDKRSSLVMAETPVPSLYCTSLFPEADLETRLSKIKPADPDDKRQANTFSAPVWLTGSDYSAGELAYLSFAPGPGGLTVENALANILTGSVSFDLTFQPFYCPPRLDVLHEIAHAIHNTAGENRKGIKLTKSEKDLWDDAEEAWTIAFDPIGQNAQAKDIGFPATQGHGGLYLTDLTHGTEISKCTLHEISRNPTKSTKPRKSTKPTTTKTKTDDTDKDDNCIIS